MQCNANGLSCSRSKYYYDIKTNVKKINKLFTNVFQKIVPFSQLIGVYVCSRVFNTSTANAIRT